eukprot:COSAG02_NODE_2393_length_8966_cov_3.095974_9_plen_137_part_00
MLETIADPDHRLAICSGRVMNSGKNCAEFTYQDDELSTEFRIYLMQPTLLMRQAWSVSFEGVPKGRSFQLRLLLDLDAGTLKMKINGQDINLMQNPVKPVGTPLYTGLTGDLCWAVSVKKKGAVRINCKALEPEDF